MGKGKKVSLLKTDDDDDLDDFLKVLGKQFTDKVEEVKAKIEEAKQGNKKSLLQGDDDTKMGKMGEDGGDGDEFELTIEKLLNTIFESLTPEQQASIEAQIEEIKKWLEEECENHPDMKEKVKKVEEKMKGKKVSLLKTDDDDDLDDFLKVLGKQFTDKVEEVKAKIEEAKQGNKKS